MKKTCVLRTWSCILCTPALVWLLVPPLLLIQLRRLKQALVLQGGPRPTHDDLEQRRFNTPH